jgi:NitT/TauT family transport system ATP-binding protein
MSTSSDLAGAVIQVKDLSSIFADRNGGLLALEHVSFDVYPEQFVCVLGPSGSGKTTLLRVLSGLLPPSSGEIYFQGQKLTGPPPGIGFVFQKPSLMPWRSVLQNITLPLEIQNTPLEIRQQKALELVELVGLQGFEQALPRDLSGGMAQRVAIARALVHDPEVLLMDEPFGSLDALTRERMGVELLRIWQRRCKTVVMVTHSISEALLLADRVLVLTQRPGHLRLDMTVELPRPRTEDMRYLPKFGLLARQLRASIE